MTNIQNGETAMAAMNEELKWSNEELLSMIEKLQSANEELLSKNQELLSTNAELETSKGAIQIALARIAKSDSDRQNLLVSTNIAILFVNDEMEIRSFTPGVTALYDLIPTDVGRPLHHITHAAVDMPSYLADSTRVGCWPIEDEVETQSGHWFLRRIQPYMNGHNERDGLVITFYEITEQKKLRMRLAAAHAVTSLLAEAESVEAVLPTVLKALRESLEAEVCLLWLVNERGGQRDKFLTCAAADTIDRLRQPFVEISRQMRFTPGNGLPGLVWERGRPVWLEELKSRLGFVRARQAAECELKSGVAAPIAIGNKFKGVIEIFTSRQLTRDPDLLNLMQTIGNDIGQLIRGRRLDDRFRDQEARKTAILNSALDCIITMDTEGQVVDFNLAAERTFGYTASQVVGRPLADLIIPKEYREEHRKGLARFLNTGEAKILGQRIELVAMRADSSQFPIELAINVSRGRDGTPFFTAYLRDITQRKQAESALLERERNATFVAQLQMAFAPLNSSELIAKTGCQMILEHFGLSRCALAELSDDSSVADVFHETCQANSPSFRGRHKIEDFASRTAMARLGRGETLTINDINDDSIPPWLATNFAKMQVVSNVCAPYLSDGRLRFTLSISKSTAYCWKASEILLVEELATMLYLRIARARAEEELVKSRSKLSMAMRSAQMGWFEWELGSDRHTGDEHWAEPLGLPSNTIECRETFIKLIHPEDVHSFGQFYQRLVSLPEGESDRFDHRVIREDGQTRWVRLQAKPIHTGLGDERRATQIIGTVSDITQQREFEISLSEARAQAVAASESKSEFLANMSHEIRTPMTAILGYADLLREYISHDEAKDYLGTIRRNGGYLLEIINDILDLSKIEAGKLDVSQELFDPARLVEDVRSIMDVRAKENHLQLEVAYDGKIPALIQSDSKRLKQILINLVGNAIKFTKLGQVKMVVSYSEHAHAERKPEERASAIACHATSNWERGVASQMEGSKIQFTIIDTGIGMTEEQLRRLFRPFEQGDSSVSRNFGGTGLGLAISRRLAVMLGGDIVVESQFGRGSTFQVNVAVGKTNAAPLVLPQPFIDLPEQTGSQESVTLNCRILVVDDRRDIRFLSNRLLTKAGATVEECEDGQLAVNHVRGCLGEEDCPDLILLDMQMPNLDGYETAGQLRKLGFAGPIVALTADAMQGNMNRCFECGCNDFLSKPIDAARMLRLVAKMTKRKC